MDQFVSLHETLSNMESEIARLFNVNLSDKLKLSELLQEYLFDENGHRNQFTSSIGGFDKFFIAIFRIKFDLLKDFYLSLTVNILIHSYGFMSKHKYAFTPARFFKLKFCFWNSEFVLTKIEICRKCLFFVLFKLFQKLIAFWGCDLSNSSLRSMLYDMVWLYGQKFVTVA